jgi:glycosyltransferase involved in cell wall biosynthesis
LFDVVHLTLMNPAYHARVYGRLARAGALMGLKVAVVGRKGGGVGDGTVHVVELDYRGRGRTLNHIAVMRAARNLRAKIYHVHTPELLATAAALKLLRGSKIVYDVHENYAANAMTSAGYRFRRVLSAGVGFVERLFAPVIDGVVLAESAFADLPFLRKVRGPTVFCPNYFAPPDAAPTISPAFIARLGEYLLYTGTLSPQWGTDAAIAAARKMKMKLVVAGHTHDARYFRRLQALARGTDVTFVGGTQYVPYADVVALIAGCRAGFALYRPDPHLICRTPTKFYEYAALGKPLYYTEAWKDRSPFGIPVPYPPDNFDFPPPPPQRPPSLDDVFAPFRPVAELYRHLLRDNPQE